MFLIIFLLFTLWTFRINISVWLQLALLLWLQTQVKYLLGKWSWWQSPPPPSPKHRLERHPSPTPGRRHDLPPAPTDRRTSAQTGECTSPATPKDPENVSKLCLNNCEIEVWQKNKNLSDWRSNQLATHLARMGTIGGFKAGTMENCPVTCETTFRDSDI